MQNILVLSRQQQQSRSQSQLVEQGEKAWKNENILWAFYETFI